MASRRQVGDKPSAEVDANGSQPVSSTAPAVPMHVIYKLLGATFLMIAAPLLVYFGTVNTIFANSTSWAGAAAAVTANIVLIGYILVAVWEDQGEDPQKVGKIE